MLKIFPWLPLVLLGTILLFRPPVDPDFGWHYKYGEYISQNKAIPYRNIFSYTLTDYAWANSYWLSELIMYVLAHTVGYIGMSLIFGACLSTVIILLLYSKMQSHKAGRIPQFDINNHQLTQVVLSYEIIDWICVVGGALILFSVFGFFMITVRPIFFSSLFMLLLIYTLLVNRRFVKFTPLLFFVWANMHADFFLGLFVFGMFTCFSIRGCVFAKCIPCRIRSWIKLFDVGSKYDSSIAQIGNKWLAFYFFISIISTFINPYREKIWETFVKELHPFQFSSISEWLPLYVNKNLTPVVIGTLFFLMLGILISLWFLRKSLDYWYLVVMFVFAVLSTRSQYFIRVFVILGSFPLLELFYFILDKFFSRIASLKKLEGISYFNKMFWILLVLISLQAFIGNLESALSMRAWSIKHKFPYDAVEYIKQNKPIGNMFNNYNWGGYLIWQLPEYKTFIDGRMPAWRDSTGSLFEEYILIRDQPHNQIQVFLDYVEKYNITWVLDYSDSKLVEVLVSEYNWQEVYRDDIAVVIAASSK